MSDSVAAEQTQETGQQSSAGVPPSGPQPGQAAENSNDEAAAPQGAGPKGLKGAGLRYTDADDVPDWAKGKTADEVLDMAQTLYKAVLNNQPAQETPKPEMPQSQPMQQPNGQSVAPPEPDLAYTNPAEYNARLQAWMQSQMQTQFQTQAAPFAQGLSEIAKAESMRDARYADVWRRYGPEIEAEVASLPAQMKTQPRFWNDAASLIAGRHMEELFKERAASQRPADSGTLETGGSVAAPGQQNATDKLAELFRDDHPAVERFKRLKWGAEQVRVKARTMGYTPDQYAEILLKGKTGGHIYTHGSPKEAAEMTHAVQAGIV